jgi:hypothetical protein
MQLPADYKSFLALSPEQIQQFCDELAERPLDASRTIVRPSSPSPAGLSR